MKTFAITGAAMLAFSFAASAQDYQKMDTFLGYTYTRFGTGNFVPAPFDANVPTYNANGGSAQWAYNFNKWFSGVIDAGAVHGGSIGNFNNLPSTFSRGGLDINVANYLFGPRIELRSHGRFTPYIQTLFGGATAWQSLPVPDVAFVVPPIVGGGVLVPNGATIRYSRTTSGFAMTAGGGLDIKLSKHVYFRPIQAEYFLTRLQPIGDLTTVNRNNFRYSAGLNFSYGSPK